MNDELNSRIRELIVSNLMLQIQPSDIREDQPLFGQDGIGLDSVDALQLVVMLDKNFGLKIANATQAREVLQNLGSIASAVRKHQQACG